MTDLVKYTAGGMPMDINERLKPCSNQEMQAEVAKLCACFDADLDGPRTSIYFEALSGQPIWAIKRACKEFRTGTVPNRKNHGFMPRPPEVGSRVREIVAPHRENIQYEVKVYPIEDLPKEGTVEERRRISARIMAQSCLIGSEMTGRASVDVDKVDGRAESGERSDDPSKEIKHVDELAPASDRLLKSPMMNK